MSLPPRQRRPTTPLDLHSLATLVNYERAISEPRFRNTRLLEVASSANDFETLIVRKGWTGVRQNKRGYLFEKMEKGCVEMGWEGMVSERAEGSAKALSEEELEEIYWMSRAHNSCYSSLHIFQYLFNSYSPTHPLLLRTSAGPSESIVIALNQRNIQEYTLSHKDYFFAAIVPPFSSFPPAPNEKVPIPIKSYSSKEHDRMQHAVWTFVGGPGELEVYATHVFDSSSMQFGNAGRGRGGELFILETKDDWEEIAEEWTTGGKGVRLLRRSSDMIEEAPVEVRGWYKAVAARVRDRWEWRDTAKWCGYCGKPIEKEVLKTCGKCRVTTYCSRMCQKKGWKFHKNWCGKEKTLF